MPNDDVRVAELLRASAASLDPDTFEFVLPRVLPVAICVDAGDLSQEIGFAIESTVREVLDKFGFRETYEWGPFPGSHFTTIFGTGTELEDGHSFRERTAEFTRELANRFRHLPWETWAKKAGAAIKVAVNIGEIVLIFVPHAGIWVYVALKISPKVWDVLKALHHGAAITEAAKELFFKNPKVNGAIGEGPKEEKEEPDWSMVLERDIVVARPFRLIPKSGTI